MSTFVRLLACGGCTHIEGIKKAALREAADLGSGPAGLRKSLKNYISSAWAIFGRAEARRVAEERRAEVSLRVKRILDRVVEDLLNEAATAVACEDV